MKVGLIDIEPKIYNTAYMQIAAHYKNQGGTVSWWTPIEHRTFHAVFCSSIFNYTDKSDVPEDAVCGGTGFDVQSRLSLDIESCDLDYSIYPQCHKSFLWFSRGCRRKCPWCVVPAKEGDIRPVDVKNLNPRGKYIVVCDNDFFGNPKWEGAIRYLQDLKMPCDFQQGIDIRSLTKKQAHSLTKLRWRKRIRIAWDNPADEQKIKEGLIQINQYIPAWKLSCYVLIGFNTTEVEDLYRVEALRRWGVESFVMPYDKKDPYQMCFTRWVNRKAVFKSVRWEDYRRKEVAAQRAQHLWD